MNVNVSMKKEVLEKIKRKAKEKNMTVSEYIRFTLAIIWGAENDN